MNDKKMNWLIMAINGSVAVCLLALAVCNSMAAQRINELQDKYDILYSVTISLAKEVDNLNAKTDDMYDEIDALRVPVEEEKTETVINYDYNYVLRVVAAECRGEPLDGIMAVAQVIRERADAKGKTPEEIVKEKYQFAEPTSMENVNENVLEACRRVLLEGESVTDKPIQYFYSTVGGFVSKTHEKKTYVMTIGNHKFFME